MQDEPKWYNKNPDLVNDIHHSRVVLEPYRLRYISHLHRLKWINNLCSLVRLYQNTRSPVTQLPP